MFFHRLIASIPNKRTTCTAYSYFGSLRFLLCNYPHTSDRLQFRLRETKKYEKIFALVHVAEWSINHMLHSSEREEIRVVFDCMYVTRPSVVPILAGHVSKYKATHLPSFGSFRCRISPS